MKTKISVQRKTKESEIRVKLDFSSLKSDYKEKIATPDAFFSHMLEHIVYRSQINMLFDIKLSKFDLSHVVFEDLGLTFGKAVRKFIENNVNEGIIGFGDAVGIIDEAYAKCAMSFENRAYFDFKSAIQIPTQAEKTLSEDLVTFFEGFVQGAKCTLHIDVLKGENAHHIWEAVYRSFGVALKNTLQVYEERKGFTAGVAGNIEFLVEVE